MWKLAALVLAVSGCCVAFENGVLLQGGSCQQSQFYKPFYAAERANVNLIDYKYSAAVEHAGKVLITGGTYWETTDFPNNFLQIYDTFNKDVWEGGDMIERRSQHTAVVKDHRLVVCGGLGLHSKLLDTCEYYDQFENKWYLIEEKMPRKLWGHGSAVLHGNLYLFGGHTDAGMSLSSYVFRGKIGSKYGLWSEIWPMNRPRVHFAYTTYMWNHILACGGVDSKGTVLKSCEIFNAYSESWANTADLAVARSNAAMVYFDRGLYVFGGYTQPNEQNATATVEFYQDFHNVSTLMFYNMVLPCAGFNAVNLY